jgi:putative transposase
MCNVLEVSRAGYYAWLKRPESTRQRNNKRLLVLIKTSFVRSRNTYGYRRIYWDIQAMNESYGRHRIARLMRDNNIQPKMRRKFKVTTDSNHTYPVMENHLQRQFNVALPNQRWVSDITYISTDEGWLYLAAVMDLYSRKIIGWSMSDNMKDSLVIDAMKMAMLHRNITSTLLVHSDRGTQYASYNFQALLRSNQIECSMSRKGNCWDNAVIESFFHTLKTECIHHKHFLSHAEAKEAIFDYIEVFYNRRRRHSYLNYKSPVEFEESAAA